MKTIIFKLPLAVAFATIISLSSCRPDRLICAYVARNKLVERTPAAIDTSAAPELFHYYDRDNMSYFEFGLHRHKGKTKLILASDRFNDKVRFNFFMGYSRGFATYDKYEKVNYIVLDSSEVKNFLNFYDKVQQPAPNKKGGEVILIDYNLSKEDFITVRLEYFPPNNNGLSNPMVSEIALWLNGRKSELPVHLFIKELKSIKW